MAVFKKSSSNSYLGIDIGSGGFKVVELANEKGRPKLMTYGYSERQPDAPIVSPLDDPKASGKMLEKILKAADVKAKKAMAALPNASVFTAIVSVPRGKNEKEMKPYIDVEVGKLTPMPLQEMITYSTFIDDVKKIEADEKKAKKEKKKEPTLEVPQKRGYVRVLVTGAAKTLVQKYIELFRAANLELDAIDTEAFALIRSLIGKDRGSIMLIDFGFMRTNLTIVEKGIPMLTRSINIGGQLVTKRIMEQMQVSEPEAEQLKRELGNAQGAAEGLDGLLDIVLQPIMHEIRYSFQLYTKLDVAEQKQVEKIILTGGSSQLPQLAKRLGDGLNLNVYLGDPWARVVHPQELRPVLDEIGPRMSVAIGLGMREIE